MRNFLVTTIFDGTTEIHSIYPALFITRHLAKRMQALYTGRLMQILFLIKGMRGVNRWKIKLSGRQSRKRNNRLFPNALERLHRKIADGIRAESIFFRTDQTRAESFTKVNAKKHRQKIRRQQRSENSQRFYRVLFRPFQN